MDARGRPVYLEINPLSDRHLTGIARYTARIAIALKHASADLRCFSGSMEVLPPPTLDWSHDQDLGRWARRVWLGRRRPIGDEAASALAIFPCGRPVERRFAFEASVLHDLTPLLLPDAHAELTRIHFRHFFAVALHASDAALAVSHSTRADASWLTDFDPARVVVAHSGPSLCVERHLHASAVERRPDVGLAVSTLEPRKNAFFLLDWFLSTDALPERAELWWVGGLGWLISRRRLNRYTRAGKRRVRLLGKVDDPTLCRLYRTAGWSVYPSLYEGFGFPVLDSLRHGTPTLAAGNSSIREFDDPNLRLFDPLDATSLDAAYRDLTGRPFVETKAALDRRYDWARVATSLLSLPGPASARRAFAGVA
jgi:glycosyltransferase involved in cell wall biosynthesis